MQFSTVEHSGKNWQVSQNIYDFPNLGCLLAWGKGHMCYLLQVLAKAITRLPSQKRAGKINKIMSHFLVSSTLPFIFFWLLASLCRMTWTFQFIIIYMIYSQKLSKKLLQGGTKCIGFCKSLIDLQNLYSARYFTSLRFNAEVHDKVIFRLLWCHAFLKMRVDIVWVLMVTFCSVVMFFYGRTFNLWLGQQAWRVWMTSLFVWINRLQIDWLFQHSN